MGKTNPIISFKKSFLQKLVDEGNWCVELREQTYHLALHPYHLTNINNSIKDLLGKGIARYDSKLNGILLGFENIKLLTQGTIVDDSFFVHIDVRANFYLFKPEVDKVLVGVVNKKSDDHVGCLVFETFNVSIPKPEDKEISDWIGGTVEIGDEISFTITLLKLDSRLPYIRGELLTNLNRNTSEDFEDDETPKKKSKKKKKSIENVDVQVDKEYKKSKRKKNDTSLEENEITSVKKKPRTEDVTHYKDRMVNGYAEGNEHVFMKKNKKGKHSLYETMDEFSYSKGDSRSQLNKSVDEIDEVGIKKKKRGKHELSLDESFDKVMAVKEKKKKQRYSVGEGIDEFSSSRNDSLLQLDESNDVIGYDKKKKKRKRSLDETVDEVVDVKKKKKKHKHSLGDSIDELSSSRNDSLLQLHEISQVIDNSLNKKKKEKRNRSLDESFVEDPTVFKKKKKKHRYSLDESVDEFSRSKNDNNLLPDLKKKKHKRALDEEVVYNAPREKKHFLDESGMDVSLSQSNESYGVMDKDASRKKKKRKKDK